MWSNCLLEIDLYTPRTGLGHGLTPAETLNERNWTTTSRRPLRYNSLPIFQHKYFGLYR